MAGHPNQHAVQRRHGRRGFSLVEMLIALTISATLLTAALAALDSMFKGYKQTTESASTHVVSRIVVNRLLGLIRTGEEFGPFPENVLDAGQNPVVTDTFELVTGRDEYGGITEITRIEFRVDGEDDEDVDEEEEEGEDSGEEEGGEEPDEEEVDEAKVGTLWYVLIDPSGDEEEILIEQPLLDNVRTVTFTLHYDVGPRLTRATIDLIVEPNDSVDLTIGADATPQTIRLVASASPRQSLSGLR